MRYQGLRYKTDSMGLYVARDRIEENGRLQPEHLVLDESGDPKWVPHPIGGYMEPLIPIPILEVAQLAVEDPHDHEKLRQEHRPELCFECTKYLDDDGDCFECGSGKFARDCTCVQNDWLCPYHQDGHPCSGVFPRSQAP